MSGLRGKKQSPFIGKRVPLEENGVPILYSRYTDVSQIVAGAPEGAAVAPVKKERKRKQQAEATAVATEPDAQPDPVQPLAKKKKKDAQERLPAAAASPVLASLPAASEKPAAESAPKKAKKLKKGQQGNAAPEQPAASAAEPDSVAAAAAGPGSEALQEAAAAAATGNAEEAAKIRSVLGFKGASSRAAPAFNFGFGVEAQVEASTQEKLARIMLQDSAVDGHIPRRVYIGGMPYSCTEDEIREFWEECGAIESMDMLTFPDSGRFRGIAFITFATEAGFNAALECDGQEANGQILKVDRCKAASLKKARAPTPAQQRQAAAGGQRGSGPSKTPGYNVAYVGNIAFESTLDELDELFGKYNAAKVRLHTDKDSGQSKGYAHVHFENESNLDECVAALDGHRLHGRNMRVGYGQPKKEA